MKKSTTIWWIVIIIIILAIVGIIVYNNNEGAMSAAPTTSTANQATPTLTTTTTTTTTETVVLNSSTSTTLGTYLVAANGMTLYKYAQDTSGVSNCTGACATAWPPYTVASAASLVGGTGINGAISTITRADGTMQVTYNGVPLYFFASDSQAGDTKGQNVGGFTVVQP